MLKRIILVTAGLAFVAVFGEFIYSKLEPSENCDVCERPLHKETYYRIHLTNAKTLDVCCPRCGLRFQKGRKDVARVEVTAFYAKRLLQADQAFYVEGSPLHFCSHATIEKDRSGHFLHYRAQGDRKNSRALG